MLMTKQDSRVARVPVDSQQTSFETNMQFKFFDDCTGADSIQSTSILIYKVIATSALKVQLRLINGISGSRKYIVYPFTGSEVITGGSFVDVSATKISPINNDLSVSELPAHPSAGFTVEKRVATAFSTTAPKRTGTAYRAQGQGNVSVSSYTASGNASGVAAGDTFLLVFTNISGNEAAEFLFQLEFEKR